MSVLSVKYVHCNSESTFGYLVRRDKTSVVLQKKWVSKTSVLNGSR